MRKDAEELFSDAYDKAEKWSHSASFVREHSLNLAKCTQVIIKQMQKNGDDSLDLDTAYVSGLMHDVGKTRKDTQGLSHPVGGYEMLKALGWEVPARVAMTHTYYGYGKVDYTDFWERFEDKERRKFTIEYLEKIKIDDYDRLIQLLDNMVSHRGVMSISDRFSDIVIRHDLKDCGAHLKELYKLKVYFDKKCGMNIYELFKSDIMRLALEEPNDPSGVREELL